MFFVHCSILFLMTEEYSCFVCSWTCCLELPVLLCTEDDNSCYRNVCKMSVVSFALAVVFIIMPVLWSSKTFLKYKRLNDALASLFKACSGGTYLYQSSGTISGPSTANGLTYLHCSWTIQMNDTKVCTCLFARYVYRQAAANWRRVIFFWNGW